MENSSSSLGYDCILPEDTIGEILIRLPVKSLVRFKTVSKSWNSIITNPTFAKTQFHHSTMHHVTSSHIILRDDNTMFTLHLDLDNICTKGKFVPLHPKFDPVRKNRGFRVLGSCHGMLCVHVRDTNDIYIWNPSTNESRLLPWPVSKTIKHFRIKLSRFGYVSSINDYKLVLVVAKCTTSYYRDTWPTLVHVYSLRQNHWREIDPPPLPSLEFDDSYVETVLLNDALYWTVCSGAPMILKFDMVNEIFEKVLEIDPNREIKRYSLEFFIGAFGDDHHKQQLCIYKRFRYSDSYYSYYHSVGQPDEVEMWVLDGRDDQQQYKWKKKFELKGRWDNLGDNHELVKVTGNGKVLIFERNVFNGRSPWRTDTTHTKMVDLLIFDCRSRKGSFIHVKNEYYLPFKCSELVYDVVNYVRTLISPNNIL